MANVVEEAFASKKGDLLSVFEGDDFHKLPVAKQGNLPARKILEVKQSCINALSLDSRLPGNSRPGTPNSAHAA